MIPSPWIGLVLARFLREIAADYGISITHASDIRRGVARVT